MAFRGAAKSWITAAFALWNFYRNAQMKILVASGSVRRSVAFVNFCLQLINSVPCLQHLAPKNNQRQSSQAFDVGPSLPDQTPSMFAVGITAQIVGFRGDLIIGDDVETNTNAMTKPMREKLADGVKEFDAILKPFGSIVFLGTPQTEASIYMVLNTRGYVTKIWPVLFPTTKQQKAYGDQLAEYVAWKLKENPRLVGQSTEPTRFSREDLTARELSWGKAGFALQFMLDTSLSDVDKYPLRLRDLIVMSLDQKRGPDSVSWGSGDHLALKDVQAIGMMNDGVYAPSNVSQSFSKYTMLYGFIDPSGKGADEATLTIGGVVNGMPFVLKQSGWLDGYGDETMKAMANIIVQYQVQKLVVEADFGQEMFGKLLKPFINKAWKRYNKLHRIPERDWKNTRIETEIAKKVQKEIRILDTLEPLFGTHRIVIAKEVFEEDYSQVLKRDGTMNRDRYSLMHQITRLTRERDCLAHDDRVEGLAGLMNMFSDVLGLDPQSIAAERSLEDTLDALNKLYGPGLEVGDKGLSTPSPKPTRGNLLTGRQRAERNT